MKNAIFLRKLLIVFISLFIFFSYSTATFADTAKSDSVVLKDLFKFDRNKDVSLNLLRSVFGQVNGVLQDARGVEPNPGIYNQMFRTFNQIMMALATILLIYTFGSGIIHTAHHGEFMGDRAKGSWMLPVRTVSGFALVIPTSSGYSLIQVFMMYIVVQGIGAAHQIWAVALDGLFRYGIIQQLPTAPILAPYTNNVRSLFASAYCIYDRQYEAYKETDYKDCVAGSDLKKPSDKCPPKLTTDQLRFASANPLESAQISLLKNPPAVSQSQRSTSLLLAPLQPSSANSTTTAENQLVGYSFTACCVDAKHCLFVSPDGTKPFDKALCESSPGAKWLNCGSATLTLSKDGDPRPKHITESMMKNIAQLFISDAYTAYIDANYTKDNDPTLFSPDPIASAVSDISRNAQDQQIQEARDRDKNKHEEEKNLGWADAGALFYQFTHSNDDLADMVTWAKQGVSVDSSACPSTSTDPVCTRANELASKYGSQSFSEELGGPTISNKSWAKPSNLGGNWWTGTINLVTNLIVRAYCGYLFGTGTPEQIFSKDHDGKPYTESGKSGTTHPIFKIQMIGHRFVIFAETLWGIAMGVTLLLSIITGFCSSYSPLKSGFTTLFRLIIAPLFMLMGMLFSMGLMMEVYIPLIPYIIFTFAVIGWLIAVLETMLAAPLVALGIAYPEGHEMLGRADPAIMLLANIFIRPTFMVFGLISGLFISQVAVLFLNSTFGYVIGSGGPFGGDTSGHGNMGIGGFELIMILAIYLGFVIAILNKSFSLITVIPDQVLKWIGGQSQFGEYSHGAEEQVKGAAGGAAGGIQEAAKGSGQEAVGALQATEKRQQKSKEAQAQSFDQAASKGGHAAAPTSQLEKDKAAGEKRAQDKLGKKDDTSIDVTEKK